MIARLRTAGGWAIALIWMICIGCGGAKHSADGVVQFVDGQPVRSGSIEFRSLADGNRYASRIADDGTFTLSDGDGVAGCPPGDYEIVVVQIVLTEDLAAEAHQHGQTVPRRYADYYTSNLRTTKVADEALIRITIETDSELKSSQR